MPKRQHPWVCKICGCAGHGEANEQCHLNGKKHLKLIMSGAVAKKTAKQERAERKAAKRQKLEVKLEAKAERDAPTSRHELVRAWVNSQFQGRVAHSRARPAKQKVAPATAMSGR